MSHSTVYRICLLVIVVLTILGGIFYYVNYVKDQTKVTEGTLVRQESQESLPELQAAAWSREDKEGEGMAWQEIKTRYI